MISCPCCGQTIDGADIDAIAQFVHLTPSEVKLLNAVVAKAPHVARMDYLIDYIWGDNPDGGPLTAIKVIDVMTCRANQKLSRVNLKIVAQLRNTLIGGRKLVRLHDLSEIRNRKFIAPSNELGVMQ